MGKDVEGINHDPSQNLPGEHRKIVEYFCRYDRVET
jgi:hypothetical protein